MVDIANLGIAVDSAPAVKGAADLDKLSTSAKGATTSVDQLGAASTKAGAQIQSNSARISAQVSQNAALESSVRRAGAAHEGLAHQVHAAESGLHVMAAAAQAQVGSFFGLSATTVRAAENMKDFEFKSSQLRTGLRLLRPLATEAGTSLGHLGLLAGAARGGLVLLAGVVAGTVAIAFENAADKARLLQQRLSDLAGGNTAQGGKSFASLSDAAKKAGVEVDVMADSFEALQKAARTVAETKGIRTSDGSVFGFKPEETANALRTMLDLFKITGLGADKSKAALDEFFITASKDGLLTKDIFDKLESASPRAARAVANAFNYVNVEQFRETIDVLPAKMADVIKALNRVSPAIAEEATKAKATVEQQVDALKADLAHLAEDIGTAGGIKWASDFIASARRILKEGLSWGDVFQFAFVSPPDDLIARASTALRESIKRSAISIWDWFTSPSAPSAGDLSDKFPRLGQGAPKALQALEESADKLATGTEADAAKINAAAASISQQFLDRQWQAVQAAPPGSIFLDYGNGGRMSRTTPNGGTETGAYSPDIGRFFPDAIQLPRALKAIEDATNNLATAATADAAKINAAAASMLDAAGNAKYSGPDDYGNSTGITVGSNATGGIYKMPGSGVDDSIRLSGRVSPGEVVAIIPQDKATGTLMAQLHQIINRSPINIGAGGSQIAAPSSYSEQEARAGKLAFNITSAQQAQARARIAANVLATSGGTANIGGSGGSVGFGESLKKNWDEDIARALDSSNPAFYNASTALNGVSSSFQAGKNPFATKADYYGTAAVGGRPLPSKTVGGAAMVYPNPFTPILDYLVSSGALSAAALANLPMGWNAPVSGPDDYSLPPPMPFSGPDDYLSLANYGVPFSGPDDYLSPSAYSGAYPGDMGLAQDDPLYGAFARGGSFTVPNRGRGGRDSVRANLDLTPGERVSVTPNEDRIGGLRGNAGGGTHVENVYIVTQGENPMASLSRNAIRREISGYFR